MGSANGNAGRVLVVVDEAVAGRELRDSLLAHMGEQRDEVFVVAPALVDSGLKHTLGDVDGAIEPAADRLRETLQVLREAGIEASGEVGDSEPLLAINDEIQKFHPDRVLLVAHGNEDSAFAERGLLEQVERDLDLPVVELVVDRAEAPHVLDVAETSPGAGRRKGWRPSYNWPLLSRREAAGIVVAIVGTLILGGLAADCAGAEEGPLGAPCIARMLIATALALVNLAHVVGLVLFQSVGYQGIWSRFFARLSLYGTPTAIVVSLLLGLAM
jgi:hypothetical protein